MRPMVRFLSDELIENIVAQAREVICKLGVEIHNEGVLALLSDHGAEVVAGSQRVLFTEDMIDRALNTAPGAVCLYDTAGRQTHDLSGHNVYFTPGSAAINILDDDTGATRTPTTLGEW